MLGTTRAVMMSMSAALICACGSTPTTPTPPLGPVAQVGSATISRAAFDVRLHSTLTAINQGGAPTGNATMEAQVRASVLRSLILDTIIAQQAMGLGFAATDAEVQAEVDRDAEAAGGLAALQTQLAGAGGSIDQLKDEIHATINEQRVEDHFAAQRAAEAEQELATGADFAATATKLSDDTGTNTKGGDLGALGLGELKSYDPDFASAVTSLSPGQHTTTPIHDAGGYDIVMVYAATTTSRSVRHILIAAPVPYTVSNRPTWFTESLFSTVAQYCQQNLLHVYITDAGANPCTGAPTLGASSPPG